FIRPFMGATEVLRAHPRYCLWIADHDFEDAMAVPEINRRIEGVRNMRLNSSAPTTRATKVPPYRFMQIEGTADDLTIAVPAITSKNRDFLPVELLPGNVILSNKCYALYDA